MKREREREREREKERKKERKKERERRHFRNSLDKVVCLVYGKEMKREELCPPRIGWGPSVLWGGS